MKKPSQALLFLSSITAIALFLLTSPVEAQQPELSFPFEPGHSFRCTQGPGGSYSHDGVRTKYALDLAAPDGTEVIAAAGGIAHVFPDQPDPSFKPPDCPTATSRNFGNHITVDHGGGYFTIYAHLHRMEDVDGKTVVTGQHLGTVDSTGWSCGNHLHFGLHSGSATNVGTSLSISATKIRAVAEPQATVSTLAATDFVCGPAGGFYHAPPATGASPFSYQSFVNGDPATPGDGVLVGEDSPPFFTLRTAIPMGGVQLLYITVFPPPGMKPSNIALSIEVPRGQAATSPCGAGQAVTIQGTVVVNGVTGYWGTLSAGDIATDVTFIRSSLSGCDVVASDLYLTQFFIPLNSSSSVDHLDAVSVSTLAPH